MFSRSTLGRKMNNATVTLNTYNKASILCLEAERGARQGGYYCVA